MAVVKCCINLDTETAARLKELVEMVPGKSNQSLVVRELIDKEYTMRKGAMNEA